MNIKTKTNEELKRKQEILKRDLEDACRAREFIPARSYLGYLSITATINHIERQLRAIETELKSREVSNNQNSK